MIQHQVGRNQRLPFQLFPARRERRHLSGVKQPFQISGFLRHRQPAFPRSEQPQQQIVELKFLVNPRHEFRVGCIGPGQAQQPEGLPDGRALLFRTGPFELQDVSQGAADEFGIRRVTGHGGLPRVGRLVEIAGLH